MEFALPEANFAVEFAFPKANFAKIGLYDLNGRLVKELGVGQYQAGSHQVVLDAKGLSSGVYIVRVEASGKVAQAKVVLVK